MPITKQEIERIKKENKEVFENLEEYDKTYKLPFQRERVDITLPVWLIRELKEKREESGKSVSRMIEWALRRDGFGRD